jgi:aromatic-L-amino-acid decarboxylase
VNRSGKIFLSHTKLAGRYTIRVTLGNPRSSAGHVRLCWDLLRDAAR